MRPLRSPSSGIVLVSHQDRGRDRRDLFVHQVLYQQALGLGIVDCKKLEPPRGVEYLAKTFWSWPRAECRGRRSATRQRRRGQAGAVPAPARDARQVWCTPHGRARSVGGASLRPAGADRPKVRQRRDLSRRRGCGRGRSGAVGVRPYAAGDA
jgi:hypothetical protein